MPARSLNLTTLPLIGGGITLTGTPQARSAEHDPADSAFVMWLASVGAYNAQPMYDDEPPPGEAAYEQHERAIGALTPSIMAAAVFALVEISYETKEDERLAETKPADAPLFRVLACLRASLSGSVAVVANDLLDRADEPFSETLLSRGVRGALSQQEGAAWAA